MMKKLILGSLLAVTVLLLAFVGDTEKYPTVKIGSKLPLLDYKMRAVGGQVLSMSDIKKENGVCIIFSCNTCPFVVGRGEDNEGWEGRYNEVASWCKENKVGIVFVNSNEVKRDGDDSMDAMTKHAEEKGYQFLYTEDKESKLANTLGAKTTPHVFLYGKELTLVYEGAIDDNNASAEKVGVHYLKDAITNLVAGKPIDPNNTKALGCSIKRL